jgi:hypothetical protein
MNRYFNNKRTLFGILCLALMLSLYSCRMITVQSNAVSTETRLPSTANSMPSITPQTQAVSTPEHQITVLGKRCLDLQPLSPLMASETDGVYFINSFGGENPDYFWDSNMNSLVPVPVLQVGTAFGGVISPNKQWIAFEVNYLDDNRNIVESRLEIFDAHGDQEVIIPWESEWGALRGWLDNESLYSEGYGENLGTIFVIYPFTNQTQQIASTFSNIYDSYPPAVWSMLPNSDLTLAVYPNGSSQGGETGYTLWDMVAGEKIWHYPSRTAPSSPPFWSPDQTQIGMIVEESLALENQAEIVVIDNSGNLVSRTDFSLEHSYVFIGNYTSWSPDARYLFFWLSIGSIDSPPQTTRLAMLDVNENNVIDFCIRSYGSGNKLIWTQDKQRLITWSDEAESNILVDFVDGKAYLFPVPIEGAINGWMTMPNR